MNNDIDLQTKELEEYHKRLELATQDLLLCREYATLLLKKSRGELGTEERIIFMALHTSLVVAYGRTFSESYTEDMRVNQAVSIKFKTLITEGYQKISSEQQTCHDFLLEERHKVFAHSDAIKHNLREHKILGAVGYFGNDVYIGYADDRINMLITNINYFLEILKRKSD